MTCSPPTACTAITPIECATTSCSSRAMCRRSSATARRDSSSFSRSTARRAFLERVDARLAVCEGDAEHEHRREQREFGAKFSAVKPGVVDDDEHEQRRRRPRRRADHVCRARAVGGDGARPRRSRNSGVRPRCSRAADERRRPRCTTSSTASGARRRKTNGTVAASTRNTPRRVPGSGSRPSGPSPRPEVLARPTTTNSAATAPSTTHGFSPRNQSRRRAEAAVAVVTASRYRPVAPCASAWRTTAAYIPRRTRAVRRARRDPSPGADGRARRPTIPAPSIPACCVGARTPGSRQERHMIPTIEHAARHRRRHRAAPEPARQRGPADRHARGPRRRRSQGVRPRRGRGPAPSTASPSSSRPAASPRSWARRARASRRSCTASPASTPSRPAAVFDRRHRSRRAQRPQAHPAAPRPRRVRVPVVQPHPDAHGGGEHRRCPMRLAGRRPDRRWVDEVVATVGLGARLDAPAVGALRRSAAARRGRRGRWRAGPRSSSPTSPPATSIPARAPRSSRSCGRPSASSARPS